MENEEILQLILDELRCQTKIIKDEINEREKCANLRAEEMQSKIKEMMMGILGNTPLYSKVNEIMKKANVGFEKSVDKR